MSYKIPITSAFLIFPFIAFLFTIPYILVQYHKYGSINKFRTIIIYSFILYLITIYFLVILPLPSIDYVKDLTTPKYNLVPFKAVFDFIKETPLVITNPSTYILALKDASFYTIAFNIIMTIPFGIYLRYYFKCSFKKVLVYSFILSLFFEITQLTGLYFIYPRAYRLFDIDDLITNTLGGILGYFIANRLKFLPTREEIDTKALEDGKTVSGLRRITLFFLDLFIVSLGESLIRIWINNDYIKYLIYFIYFVIMPSFMNNQTLGGKFLNIKFEFKINNFFGLLLKEITIILYYQFIPSILASGISYLSKISLNHVYLGLIIIAYFLTLFFIYVITLIKIWKNGYIFYDKVSKVKYISTILEGKNV